MFYTWWLLSAALLLAVAVLFGKKARGNILGILIDDRQRYSLNHLQVVMWNLLILSTWLAVLFASSFEPGGLAIPTEVLGLIGISLGSAAAAGAIKADKNVRIARMNLDFTANTPSPRQVFTRDPSPPIKEVAADKAGKVALELAKKDEISVDVTKFQNYLFTVVAGITYVALAYKAQGFPELPQQLIWLIGISHAGYLGGKVPDNP